MARAPLICLECRQRELNCNFVSRRIHRWLCSCTTRVQICRRRRRRCWQPGRRSSVRGGKATSLWSENPGRLQRLQWRAIDPLSARRCRFARQICPKPPAFIGHDKNLISSDRAATCPGYCAPLPTSAGSEQPLCQVIWCLPTSEASQRNRGRHRSAVVQSNQPKLKFACSQPLPRVHGPTDIRMKAT
jgi:hypothetical protein